MKALFSGLLTRSHVFFQVFFDSLRTTRRNNSIYKTNSRCFQGRGKPCCKVIISSSPNRTNFPLSNLACGPPVSIVASINTVSTPSPESTCHQAKRMSFKSREGEQRVCVHIACNANPPRHRAWECRQTGTANRTVGSPRGTHAASSADSSRRASV